MNRSTMFLFDVVVLAIIGAPLCFGQSQLVSDTFDTGPTSTYLGANWTGCGYDAGAYSRLMYENAQAGGSGFYGQDCALYIGYGAFPSDQYAVATLVTPNPSGIKQAAIQLRGNASPFTPESYIACGWNAQDFHADYHYRIWSLKPKDPGATSLYLSTVTPATNDVIWCQVLGSTVTMKVNGTTIATVNDTSGVTSGYPGLYYMDPNGGPPSATDIAFDNFVAGSGPALVSVDILPDSSTVFAGTFVQFTATALFADGSTATINNWLSSDNSIATVDGTGLAFAANAGTVTLTAASGSDSGVTTMIVQPGNGYSPLVSDSFSGNTGFYLGSNWTGCGYNGGAYSRLTYQNNQAGGSGYYSQDCALYTGFGTFPGDQYATAVMVAPAPTSRQASLQLRANAIPATAESYVACGWDAQDFPADYHYRIWSLRPYDLGPTNLYLSRQTPAKNDVIWCQVLGSTVTMQVNGKTIAVVTDTSGNTTGYTGMYYVDPNPDAPPITDVIFDNFVAGRIDHAVLASLSVTPSSASVFAGSSAQFTASGTYTDGSRGNAGTFVTWTSSNPAVATVSATGLASGVSPGTVTISAASGTNIGSATFTVRPIPPTITFKGAPYSASYNSTFTVTATTNAGVLPSISGTSGICSVGRVTGTAASAQAIVTMTSGTGTCTTAASWPAFGKYSSATATQRTAALKVSSSIAITSNSPNPSTLRQAVAVGSAASGTGAGPTGSVTVNASTGESCSATLSSNRTASCTISFSRAGTRTLTARYAGNSNFNSSSSSSVSQTVNAPTVTLNPTGVNFGYVARNTASIVAETITNIGTGALINLYWSISGANEFRVSSATCAATLNPGASCVLNLRFRPNSTGTRSGTLRLTDNAVNSPQTIALTGIGY
ncbi:MAG TPA: Ig-like domain-containing protein [Terriglobales bacterium]